MTISKEHPARTISERFAESSRDALGTVGSIRIAEFALFFLLIAHTVLPLPSVGFSPSNVIMAGIVVLALFRRPQFEFAAWQWVIPVFALGLFFAVALSIFSEPTDLASDWQGRTIRLVATFAFAMVMASGRIDIRSGLYGMATALVINVPLFLAGVLPAPYGEYLTGMIGDKNVAGLIYAVVGVLVLHYVKKPWLVVAMIAFFGSSVWLTGSRTSIAAFVAALGWMVVAPRLPLIGRWMLAAAIYVVVDLLSEDYSRIGVFSDRIGSDLLRSRIDAASELKVQDAGFFGAGLGEAYITFSDEPTKAWFFHNSYWTALVEGGWIWAIILVALTVVVMLRPFTADLSRGQIIAQAVGIVLLLCAVRLGEVFLTMPWALAFGFALQMHIRRTPITTPSHSRRSEAGSP